MTVPVAVAVDAPLSLGDAALTYAAVDPPPRGTAVLVPLRTRLTVGYVLGPAPADGRALRPIVTSLPEIPRLPGDLMTLAEWIAHHYLCSVGEALAAMLPPGLMTHLRVHLTVAPGLQSSDTDVPRALRTLQRRAVDLAVLRRRLGVGAAARLSALVTSGSVRVIPALPAAPSGRPPARRRLRLRVHRALWNPSPGARTVLLLGEEREGTYLAGVAETLARGRQVLALFPAVRRAEEFAARVRDLLGASVAVLHGDLPDEERVSRWLAIRRGDHPVVAGTRAAVFAPLERPGLVIVDDEGDVGHREERVPRYHVRDVAQKRATDAILLLADHVPATETFALSGRPGVEVLRVGGGAAPRVVVIDLRRRGAPGPILEPPLVDTLARVLKEGGRALLFVHRKGYASLLVCADCGYSPRCARCDIPLAFDEKERLLSCRYCHDRQPPPSLCPRCGGRVFTPYGAGTQRVARFAQALRLAPVLRLDSDVAPTPQDAGRILLQFREQGGILVATPLVLAVEDPPRVEMAGVVLADASLRRPDFRAPESGLRVLWQVRGLSRSWCLVQTYMPDHPVLLALRRGDLRLFYREELRLRRPFHYPPYGEILAVEVVGPGDTARQAAASLAGAVGEGTEVLGPAPLRRGPQSRWQVVFRGPGTVPRDGLSAWLRRMPSRVRVAVDVNP